MLVTRNHVKKQFEGKEFPLLKGPLLAIVHFRFSAPKKLTGAKRISYHNRPHINKPDGDNLEKFLNDALNGILWDDDSRIAWLLRSKSITKEKNGETIIFVRELPLSPPEYETMLSDIMEHIRLDDGDN